VQAQRLGIGRARRVPSFSASRLSAVPALGPAPVGGPLAPQVRLGRGLLPSPPRTRTKPRLRPSLSGPALGENPLENVANQHTLRRGPPPRKPAQARLAVHRRAHAKNHLNLMSSPTSITRSNSSFPNERTSCCCGVGDVAPAFTGSPRSRPSSTTGRGCARYQIRGSGRWASD
jgi:hypothetical protein